MTITYTETFDLEDPFRGGRVFNPFVDPRFLTQTSVDFTTMIDEVATLSQAYRVWDRECGVQSEDTPRHDHAMLKRSEYEGRLIRVHRELSDFVRDRLGQPLVIVPADVPTERAAFYVRGYLDAHAD